MRPFRKVRESRSLPNNLLISIVDSRRILRGQLHHRRAFRHERSETISQSILPSNCLGRCNFFERMLFRSIARSRSQTHHRRSALRAGLGGIAVDCSGEEEGRDCSSIEGILAESRRG